MGERSVLVVGWRVAIQLAFEGIEVSARLLDHRDGTPSAVALLAGGRAAATHDEPGVTLAENVPVVSCTGTAPAGWPDLHAEEHRSDPSGH